MRRAVFNMRDVRPVWAPPPSMIDDLRTALPAAWEVIDVRGAVTGRGDGGGVSEEAIAAARGAEIYFGLGFPRELLLAALEPPARLRWVHTGSAGVRSILHPELVESDIILTNSAGIHAEPMAESVIGMILYFARGLDYAVRAQQERRWGSDAFEDPRSGVREIAGLTVGIVGLGGIGRAVARRARALGMRVVATRRRQTDDPDAEVLSGEAALDSLLRMSDFVVITVPSTSETRGMIGARELGLMRNDAVLINVARGDVTDESALVDALRSGALRGAGLDVFTEEPLPAESPFWDLPNLLITPHVSPTSQRFWERQRELILDNVRRYLAGEALRNVVDTAAGY